MQNVAKTMITAVLWLLLPLSAAAGVSSDSPTQLANQLLLDMQKITGVPAFSITAVQNGHIIWEQSTGYIDIDDEIAADQNSMFRLASVSKGVTATMVAYLVQEGRLDVDAPLSHYMENLPTGFQDITVLQLLNHTSGMPHYQSRDALISQKHYSSSTDSIAAIGSRKLLAEPGKAYHYSSHGFTLLGALIEAVTGENFVLELNRFRAAFTGRATPVVENVNETVLHRSLVYELGPNGATKPTLRDQSYTWTGGGMEATATDLAFWGDAVLHSEMLTDSTRKMMFTPFQFSDGSTAGTYLYRVAFGWRAGVDGFGRKVVHHAGVTQGARSVVVMYPEEGLSIALLSNSRWTASIERTAFGFANLFLSDARLLPIEGTKVVSGHFNGEEMSVWISPGKDAPGLLTEEGGALSSWLNRFDPQARQRNSWPLYKLKTSLGSQMIMVGTIGLINLQQISSEDGLMLYRGRLGKSRALDLLISRGQFRRSVSEKSDGE